MGRLLLLEGQEGVNRLDPDLLLEYQDLDLFEGPPVWKYPVEQPPRLGVIIDDCLGTPLLSKPSAGLVNMCTIYKAPPLRQGTRYIHFHVSPRLLRTRGYQQSNP